MKVTLTLKLATEGEAGPVTRTTVWTLYDVEGSRAELEAIVANTVGQIGGQLELPLGGDS